MTGTDTATSSVRSLLLYGSCVSRDTLEHTKDSASVAAYVARQSMISAASAPSEFPDEVTIASKFQLRMVQDDFASSAFDTFRRLAKSVDGVVIDLVDERTGVVELSDGRFVTRSLEYRASELPQVLPEGRVLAFGDDEHFRLWSGAAHRFVDLLEELGLKERTLLIEATFADRDQEGRPAPRFEGIPAADWNASYERYYEVLRSRGLHSHRVAPSDAVTTADHRWGPAAYHYASPAYTHIAREILEVVRPRAEFGGPRRNITRYQFPRFSHDGIEDFVSSDVERGIHTIDYNGSPLDLLVQPEPGADTMIVSFHAAMASGVSTPVFVGVGVSSDTGAHRVFLSDPSLELDASLMLAWHAGNDRQDLQRDLPTVLEHLRSQLGAQHVVFYGASGGGFAALYYSAQFPGSLALPTNPQTIIANYEPEVVARYVATCWGEGTGDDRTDVLTSRLSGDLRDVYRVWPGNTVAYLQNRTDVHVEKHLAPFLLSASSDADCHLLLGEWGSGHVAPPKDLMSDVLAGVARCSGSWADALRELGFANVSADARARSGVGV